MAQPNSAVKWYVSSVCLVFQGNGIRRYSLNVGVRQIARTGESEARKRVLCSQDFFAYFRKREVEVAKNSGSAGLNNLPEEETSRFHRCALRTHLGFQDADLPGFSRM